MIEEGGTHLAQDRGLILDRTVEIIGGTAATPRAAVEGLVRPVDLGVRRMLCSYN